MLSYRKFLGSTFWQGECEPVILQVQLQRLVVRLVESGFPSKPQIGFLRMLFITLKARFLLLPYPESSSASVFGTHVPVLFGPQIYMLWST